MKSGFKFKKIKLALTFGLTMSLLNVAMADDISVSLKWKYQNAQRGTIVKDQITTEAPRIPGTESYNRYVGNEKIIKTLFLVRLATTIKKSIKEYEETCKNVNPLGSLHNDPRSREFDSILPPEEFKRECKEERETVASNLLVEIKKHDQELQDNYSLIADDKVMEIMDLGRKLAKNMKEKEIYFPYPINPPMPIPCDPATGCIPVRMDMVASMGGMNVTAGGAQDINSFRKMVNDGLVPSSTSLPIEGFLSEFDLSIDNSYCKELICLVPALYMNSKKMFVQIGMGSNMTKEIFKRNPVNLSIVLDISGSMSATDNTEKTRLDWAKETIRHIVNELNAEDYLSIVIFDSDSEIFLGTANVTNKNEIIRKVNSLRTGGSTNLEKGLRNGYQLVSENFITGYENRVILISDAGLNTGTTDDTDLLKLVSDYAGEKIGLTAVGLGLNFNQKFIHQITKSQGGNYVFVNSGKQMLKLVNNFNYLVTPVAYNFKARLSFGGINAKLKKAYGVPMNENEQSHDLIDIRTLFFSENGGAILLEYDLGR